MIHLHSNSLGEEELEAVRTVFQSRWLGRGKECQALEEELSAFWGVEQVLLTNCATAAIGIALKAYGIGPGDEVLLPTIHFVGVPNAVIDCGATPIFADVDLDTFNILPSEIERLQTSKTKAVFLLHYGGHPCDFDAVRDVTNDGVLLLEDSVNAVASHYKGVACGALGDASVFSFDAMKTLVMGDGGALVIRDQEAFERAQSLRYLGFCPSTVAGFSSADRTDNRWWEYDLTTTSGRFVSNDVLAALGRVQLRKLPTFIERRKQIWERYQEVLADVPEVVRPPEPLADTSSSYYLYWLRVPGRRDVLATILKEKGIYTSFHYVPLHKVPYFRDGSKLAHAETITETALNLPIHQNLSDIEVDTIVESIRAFLRTSRPVHSDATHSREQSCSVVSKREKQPQLSVVAALRNVYDGGGVLHRASVFVRNLVELSNRVGLDTEIALVEWNPEPHVPQVRESLVLPRELGCVTLRLITVPNQVHRTLPGYKSISFFESIAKNVGLRRARGCYWLIANPDLLFTPEVFQFLCRGPLDEKTLYRIDRYDTAHPLPVDASVDRQMELCRTSVCGLDTMYASMKFDTLQHVEALDGGHPLPRRLLGEYERMLADPAYSSPHVNELLFPVDGIHTNASGCFLLMHSSAWRRIRGHAEFAARGHADSVTCWSALSAGNRQQILEPPCRMFHQAHDRSSTRNWPTVDWYAWYESFLEARTRGELLRVNSKRWGFEEWEFEEWELSRETNGHWAQVHTARAPNDYSRIDNRVGERAA